MKIGFITSGVFFVLMLSMAACKKYEPVLPPDIKMNSDPVQRYRATLKLVGAPGPLRVRAKVGYGIKNNYSCVPIDSRRSFGGSRPYFQEDIEFDVRNVGGDVYEFSYYDDAIKDEDYYGMGLCNWSSSPIFIINIRGVAYSVGQPRSVGLGDEYRMVCDILSRNRHGNCVAEAYAEKISSDSVFYPTMIVVKE